MINIFDNGAGPFIYVNNEKVYIKESDIDLLNKGCIYENGGIVETEEYRQNILKEEQYKIKLEKKKQIEQIATLSDQLNLLASTLEMIVSYIEVDKPEIADELVIIQSREVLNGIKTILAE